MALTKACNNLRALRVAQVLAAELAWTEAILHCTVCGQHLLAEIVQHDPDGRIYRLTELQPGDTQQTLRSLAQGSCDLSRARNELNFLAHQGIPLKQKLRVDQAGEFAHASS